MMKRVLSIILLLLSQSLYAGAEFASGPVIEPFGKHAPVNFEPALQADMALNIVFDVSDKAEPGKLNRRFDSLARFINMHVANGVKKQNIKLALVVHGKASFDLLKTKAYQSRYNAENPNLTLLNQLAENQVDIYLCGQSAAYHGIDQSQLHEAVSMSLSAMTANAVLAAKGYTLNPF